MLKMKKTSEFAMLAVNGITDVYNAVVGLKVLKETHKKELDEDLDISTDLNGITENLKVIIRMAERFVK